MAFPGFVQPFNHRIITSTQAFRALASMLAGVFEPAKE